MTSWFYWTFGLYPFWSFHSCYYDYCSAVFTNLTDQQRLRSRQTTNACVCFIFNLHRDFNCVSSFYDELGRRLAALPLADDRRDYLIGCLVYLILKSLHLILLISWISARDLVQHPVFCSANLQNINLSAFFLSRQPPRFGTLYPKW